MFLATRRPERRGVLNITGVIKRKLFCITLFCVSWLTYLLGPKLSVLVKFQAVSPLTVDILEFAFRFISGQLSYFFDCRD